MERVKIDLVPSGVMPNVYASQFDLGRTIRFYLTDEGADYTLTGTETITIKMRKPDNSEKTISIANTSSNYVDWTTASGELDLSGVYLCEISITANGEVIGSANFVVKAELDPFEGKVKILSASGNPAHFNTDLSDNAVEAKLELHYNSKGYTSATVINTSNTAVENKVPYQLRPTPVTANRCLEKLIGVSCACNQLCPISTNNNTQTLNSVTMTDNRDGSYTFSGTASADCIFQVMSQKSWQAHKYVLKGGANGGSATDYSLAMRGAGGDCFDFGNGNIWDATGNTWKGIVIYVKNGQNVDGLIFKPNIIDLTQMFGSEVADYLYNLENS